MPSLRIRSTAALIRTTAQLQVRWLKPAIGLILMLPLGCSGPPSGELAPSHDLLSELAAAEVISEISSIDFASPEAPRYLVAGWSGIGSGVETQEKKPRKFTWATGEESIVEFPLVQRRGIELVFTCRPFLFPEAPVQTVAIQLNGREVDRLRLAPGIGTYRVSLTADHLVLGSNRLRFVYGYSRRPREVLKGSADERSLAVAWYEIRLESGSEPGPSAPRVDADGALVIPYGVQIDYYLSVAPPAELRVGSSVALGSADGQLEILVREEGRDEQRRAVVRAGTKPAAVPLTGSPGADSPRIVRLSLRAYAPGRTTAADAVALVRPTIWSRPASDRPRETPPSRVEVPAGAPRRPNVIIYLIDTLRADHLGCYGYDRAISPAIDAFAEEAILFENAIAQSSWTKASVASIFTGLWPVQHGAVRHPHKLSAAAVTLPEMLREAGYHTAAFVANPNVTDRFGFDQGFDEFNYLLRKSHNPSHQMTAAVVEWLQKRREPQPFFLYVHNVDPHDPYAPPDAYRRQVAPEVPERFAREVSPIFRDLLRGRRQLTPEILAHLEALYDADVATNDHAFGTLLDYLKEKGLYRDALILLLSDHGEEFNEHRHLRHGRSLHGESLRVPLILKLPAGDSDRGGRVAAAVQHIDVLPTLLSHLDLEVPAHLRGRDLLAAAALEPVPIFSYLHLDGPARVSVRDGRWKLILRYDGGRFYRSRLYDLASDPAEQHDLAGDRPVRAGYLASAMRRLLEADHVLASEEAIVDERIRKDLQALGYVP
ncbi:MAG: sulfatase-like hydrolase/transferase [bacterium]|nr:sulfatase-like hydrolase/transferase [bacterium]